VETVQYHKLVPMLLNELQRQERALDQQRDVLTAQAAELARLRRDQAALRAELARLVEDLAHLARLAAAASSR
jgi:cell division protein FtsB